jgi:hypothetical protein
LPLNYDYDYDYDYDYAYAYGSAYGYAYAGGTSSQAPCPGLGPAEERTNDALVGRALRISWMCSARLAHVCVFTVASVFL